MRRAPLPLAALAIVAAAPAPGFTIGGTPFAQADILDARAMPDMEGGASIMLTLTPAAARRLQAITAARLGQPLAVMLDGRTIVEPVVEAPIADGVLQLTAEFPLAEATTLAKRISGKDPLPDSMDQ